MAVRLTQLLDPARINLHVQATRRTVALNEVARLLTTNPEVTNFDGFYQELLARERLDTTYLGNAIALPHARTEHVNSIVLAIGRSSAGIHFENCNQTVHLMFILGTPKSNPTDYLMVVSCLCKILKETGNRVALMTAATPEEFIAALTAAEAKLHAPA